MKKLAVAILAIALFVVGFWVVVVPGDLLRQKITGAAVRNGLSVEMEGFRKGLFYSVSAGRMTVGAGPDGTNRFPLVTFEGLRAHLDASSVLKLDPKVRLSAAVAGGSLDGTVSVQRNGSGRITGSGINIQSIDAFRAAGIKGSGLGSFQADFSGREGQARVLVSEMKMKTVAIGGAFLPLDLFERIQGVVLFHDRDLEVKSLTAEGKGISARVRGTVRGDDVDIRLEISLDSTLEAGYVYRALLQQYMVSPGYYEIPIRTTLSAVDLNK